MLRGSRATAFKSNEKHFAKYMYQVLIDWLAGWMDGWLASGVGGPCGSGDWKRNAIKLHCRSIGVIDFLPRFRFCCFLRFSIKIVAVMSADVRVEK